MAKAKKKPPFQKGKPPMKGGDMHGGAKAEMQEAMMAYGAPAKAAPKSKKAKKKGK